MSENKCQGTVEQAIQGVVTIASGTLNQCQDFVTNSFPTYMEYFHKLKTFIIQFFTVYILALLEGVHNFVINTVNVVKNLVAHYYGYAKSIISYPFTVVGRIYNWAIDTLKHWIVRLKEVKKEAQGRVKTATTQAKEGYDRVKQGNITVLTIWRNILDTVIDFLNGWIKNADEPNHIAKVMNDWNVISYLEWAKLEQKSSHVDHTDANEN